jgi:hypothetical protein
MQARELPKLPKIAGIENHLRTSDFHSAVCDGYLRLQLDIEEPDQSW